MSVSAIYALHSAGFQAQGFEDGLSCWQALQTQQPELIILDVMLPPIFIVLALTAGLSALLSRYTAKRITQPINELNLEYPGKCRPCSKRPMSSSRSRII